MKIEREKSFWFKVGWALGDVMVFLVAMTMVCGLLAIISGLICGSLYIIKWFLFSLTVAEGGALIVILSSIFMLMVVFLLLIFSR